MRTLLICLALMTDGAMADSAQRFYVNGRSLLTDCTATDAAALNRCNAYITGAIDSYEQWQSWGDIEPQICRPPGTGIATLRGLVVRQLREDREHMDDLHKQASGAVLNALLVTYPCLSPRPLAGR